ncbi:MAG: hypothetical protein OEZ41_13535 [Nitrospirota bacterium]|nr:hypothetical protein [Nitrospirota bacterium]
MVPRGVPQVTIRLNASPNYPIVLNVLAVNQPGTFHLLERVPLHLPDFANYYEQSDFDRHSRRAAFPLCFE